MQAFNELFGGPRVMAILRNMFAPQPVEPARRAWDLGIDLEEVPIHCEEYVEGLAALLAYGSQWGKLVGAEA